VRRIKCCPAARGQAAGMDERDERQTAEERSKDYARLEDGTRIGEDVPPVLYGADNAGGHRTRVRPEDQGYGDGGEVGVEPFPGRYADGLSKPTDGPGAEIRDSNTASGEDPSKKV